MNKFESWVTDFFNRKSLGEPVLTDDLRKIVADYCQRGLRFMAFDVLDVPAGQQTVAPLVYRFKCDRIYYPLKITNLYGGKGTVEVFYALNPWRDSHADCPHPFYLYRRRNEKEKGVKWIFSQEIHLSTEELKKLHPQTEALFRDAGASFFATKYEGELQFESDIWLNIGYNSPEFLCMRFLSLLQEADTESVEFLVLTPFGLNRQKTLENLADLLASLKDLSHDEDLKRFKIKSRSSLTGVHRNQFDKKFIDSHLKGKRWGHYIFKSDTKSLHFFVVRAPTGNIRIPSCLLPNGTATRLRLLTEKEQSRTIAFTRTYVNRATVTPQRRCITLYAVSVLTFYPRQTKFLTISVVYYHVSHKEICIWRK